MKMYSHTRTGSCCSVAVSGDIIEAACGACLFLFSSPLEAHVLGFSLSKIVIPQHIHKAGGRSTH